MEKSKGSGFLKVCGILMIIGGVLGIILCIFAILGFTVLQVVNEIADAGISTGTLWIAAIIGIISSVMELVAGIIGVKNCNNPAKAGTCMGWGIAIAALTVVSTILNVMGGGEFSITNLAVGLVIPVLFIIGASMNKSSAPVE